MNNTFSPINIKVLLWTCNYMYPNGDTKLATFLQNTNGFYLDVCISSALL